jgi:nucleoside-diphosphate-sugar epimerase
LKLLVTGAAGRLGSDLIIKLTEEKHEVNAFDIPDADFHRLKANKYVEILKGDIRRIDDIEKAVKGVDGIFHLAAILPPQSEAHKQLTEEVNVKGTENLLTSIRSDNIQLIFPSSVMVYGITVNENPPVTENHVLSATDTYSASKIRCEELIKSSDISYTILRISGIYAVELIELPETIPFKRDQRVNFIDRRDTVQSLISAMKTKKARNKTFNIAGDRTWQMTGEEFINQLYNPFNIIVDTEYSKTNACFDWIDTTYSQSVLSYQNIDFEQFMKELEELAQNLF